MLWELARVAAAVLTAFVAVYIDRRHDLIPNWLTLTVVPAGIIAGVAADDPWTPVLGLAVALGVGLGAFTAGYVRGGAAKLLFAVGTLVGWRGALIVTAVALLYALVHHALVVRGRRGDGEADELRTMRAAPPIALGVVVAAALELWLRHR